MYQGSSAVPTEIAGIMTACPLRSGSSHQLAEQLLSGNTRGHYHSCPGERWEQQYAHAVADTLYAPCGDLSLAYQVFGDGPVELVYVAATTRRSGVSDEHVGRIVGYPW